MLSVLSSNPSNQESNVYIDSKPKITFSHELHDSSLTTDNFRIYLMPGWAGSIPITSITKSGPEVTLIPEYDFPPNAQYAVWVRGDDDTGDLDLKGVASVIGDTLDGHVTIVFDVGSKSEAVENAIEEVTVTAETLEATDPIPQEILEGNKFLDILGTYPNDGANNISGLTQIVYNFDQEIQSTDISGGVNNAVSGLVSITAEPIIFGADTLIPSPTPPDVSIQDNLVAINIDENELTINTIYSVTLFKTKVVGVKQEKLPSDYTFEFTSKLVPLYTNVSSVRLKGGHLIPASMPNTTILRYIHDASIWITAEMGRSTAIPSPIPYKVTEATIYKTICEIARGVTIGQLRYIRDKQLADLRIMYDNKLASNLIDSYCTKAENILASISPLSGGSQIGIKSKSSTRYPGAKRHIHKYTNRRFGG